MKELSNKIVNLFAKEEVQTLRIRIAEYNLTDLDSTHFGPLVVISSENGS